MLQRRRLVRMLAIIAVGAATLAVCAVPYTAFYRNARYASMPLAEQLRTQDQFVNDPIFLYHLGRKLNDREQFAHALPFLERSVGLDPEAAPARDEWAKALLGCGRVSDAFGQLRQFVGTHPAVADAHFLMGKFYVTQENHEQAGRALEAAVKLDPDNAEAWSMLAHERIKLGNNGGALTALDRAVQLRPNSANDHLQFAVLISSKDPQRARNEYARATALAPKDGVCRQQYGRFLLDAGDLPGAEREERAAFSLDGGDVIAAVLLARALGAEGKPGDALPYLQQAARLAPTDAQPADALRRVYRQLGDKVSAAQWDARYMDLTRSASEHLRLVNATQAHPNDRAAHRRLAADLARTGDINGCVREHAFANHVTPDNPRALVAAARDLDDAGYSALALPLVRRVTAVQQRNPQAYETLAEILIHLNRLHEAAINYERIRDLRADKRAAYKRKLADAAARIAVSSAPEEQLLRQAQHEQDAGKAIELLQRALTIDPENTRCLRALLRLQFALQQSDEAAKTAQKLAALSPEDGAAHTLLVVLFLRAQGDRPLREDDYQTLRGHLQAASDDASVAPLFLYARGLLALKHGEAKAAVQDLEVAARLDPNAFAVYRQLAEAKSRTGDVAGAKRDMAEFERRTGDRSR